MHLKVCCCARGCTSEATHHVEFRAWAAGAPKVAATCVAGRIPQPLCRKHARAAVARDILTKTGLAAIQIELERQGRGLTTYDDILIVAADGCPALEAAQPATETRQ